MKKKFLALVTGAALLAATASVPAFAGTPASVTLNDVKNHMQGQAITIAGTATNLTDVIVEVFRPDNSLLFYDDVAVIGGMYSETITLPFDTIVGEYKIVVGQSTVIATDTFTVTPYPTDGNGGGNGGGGGGGGTNNGGGGTNNGGDNNGNHGKPINVDHVVEPGQSKSEVKTTVKVDGKTVKGTVTNDDLKASLNSATGAVAVVIVVPATGDQQAQLTLTAEQLGLISAANAGNSVVFTTGTSSVALPASVLKNVPAGSDISITVNNAADQAGTFSNQVAGATVVGTPVSYEVNVMTGGNSAPITVNGTDFVKRSFVVDGNTDLSNAGVLFIENGKVRSVPATFSKNDDGTFTVTIKRPGFSTYAVATHAVAFNDIGNSYAKANIESLANKFLLYGTSTSTFSPENHVTRAEFAAMLTRAMGLNATKAAPFTDVSASDWFANDVAAVYEAGLVNGVGNDQFDPNADISRQDLTVMLSKALKLLGVQNGAPAPSHQPYVDASSFSDYAKDSISNVTEAGLMTGEAVNGGFEFHPGDSTTREAAAIVLFNLLNKAHLIN
ncbi:S-layer homology domain-containing protein [Tumebacillus flagellatus]|uniref:SLH domain-containing protein n=1 Tax=Tumebacillus flagellatus TaxID=1157490 RepID=A0A074LJ33_9BACL|nr:S-layer homology domain-containing protein [Tumebacillus flagellatus]KEO82186.1 hypothetical protein EL26_16750 [Tumebacillus flagellatus]